MVTKNIISILCLMFSTIVLADNSAAKLAESLKKIETFQGVFEQKINDANGEHVAKSHGNVIIRRPGKFYWKSQAPESVIVVGDGHNLWTYDVELAQVTKQNLKKALGSSPAALLAGSVVRLEQDFKIAFAKKNQCQHSDECYSLHPKQRDAAFANILIGFSKGKLTEIRMFDPLGQDVYTLFSQVKINDQVDNALFQFVPPKGVDVIRN